MVAPNPVHGLTSMKASCTTPPNPILASNQNNLFIMPGEDDAAICTSKHALYAFDVLSAHFEKRDPIPPPFDNADEAL